MTPQDFIAKWRANELKERSASQSHFNDLCALLGLANPTTADPTGEWFTFEKGASKTSGGEGWADVWRKECFAWEYKGKHANLDKAYQQLLQYAVALEQPPLLIVSDMDRIIIRTNWTNSVQEKHEILLDDLLDGDKRAQLKHAFTDSEELRPRKTRQELTEETAGEFASLAQRLRTRGHDPAAVAHFVNQLVFCMFAEDVDLLPNHMFTKMLQVCRFEWDNFPLHAGTLFRAMADKGGMVGFERIEWFNGGLFDGAEPLPLTEDDVEQLAKVAKRDWSQIDPSILGTLFERGLDPAKRSQLGAHYTDREKIMMIVKPVIIDPLEGEWVEALAKMTALIEPARRAVEASIAQASTHRELNEEVKALQNVLADKAQLELFEDLQKQKRVKALDNVRASMRAASRRLIEGRNEAKSVHSAFIERLVKFRVLDPACGSGNFLYVALRSIKDIEHRANLDAEALGLPRGFPRVGPECVLGIELNPYAAELARVSVWIGEIQWMRRNGFDAAKNPILRTLDTIECRDAVLAWKPAPANSPRPPSLGPAAPDASTPPRHAELVSASMPPTPDREAWTLKQVQGDGEGADSLIPVRAEWPVADVVVGNPPFLGNKKMISGSPATKKSPAKKGLGEEYTVALRKAWSDVPGGVDLVCYWFAKAWEMMATGKLQRVGLVATNSIRGGTNREVLKPIVEQGRIFEAWSDEGWTVDGAAVRVSMVCFDTVHDSPALLDGMPFDRIHSDLTAQSGIDFTQISSLLTNVAAFIGDQKTGAFDINGTVARQMLALPTNPNGRPNSDVVVPWLIGRDVTDRPSDKWIIDFGNDMPADEAALFEAPFTYLQEHVMAARGGKREERTGTRWWIHQRPRPAMRAALSGLKRFIVTPRVAKHRFFKWASEGTLPDTRFVVFAKNDDINFGILSSIFHEKWSLATCSWHGVGNDPTYNAQSCFETFPFPEGLTPNIAAADYADDPRAIRIAAAAARLNTLRENWLNPEDLVVRVPEVVPGYPDRILPKDEEAAKELKKRTLTNLYNARPAWLDNAHKALDEAVAESYGWGADYRAGLLTEDEILARLFRLNQERAGGVAPL